MRIDVERMLAHRKYNETEEHYLMKELGRLWLYEKQHCRNIALEVYVNKTGVTGKPKKQITDVLGIKYSRKQGVMTKTVYSVESKASRGDYNNGYSVSGNYNYLIVPKGLLSLDELPKGIGLLEVDLEKLETGAYLEDIVTLARRSSRRELIYNVEFYERNIVKRLTNEVIYQRVY